MSNATELLKRALEALNQNEVEPMLSLQEDILTFLDAEPEEEPVNQRKVFICTNCEGVFCVPVSECDCAAEANQFTEGYIVAKPEPEAEPVAWWFVYSDGPVADGQSYESEDDCVEAWAYEIESGLGKAEPFFRHHK
jgi:hypothetical protein